MLLCEKTVFWYMELLTFIKGATSVTHCIMGVNEISPWKLSENRNIFSLFGDFIPTEKMKSSFFCIRKLYETCLLKCVCQQSHNVLVCITLMCVYVSIHPCACTLVYIALWENAAEGKKRMETSAIWNLVRNLWSAKMLRPQGDGCQMSLLRRLLPSWEESSDGGTVASPPSAFCTTDKLNN